MGSCIRFGVGHRADHIYLTRLPTRIGFSVARQPLCARDGGLGNHSDPAPPVQISAYQVKRHWHDRFHADPANIWLRRVVADVMHPPKAPTRSR